MLPFPQDSMQPVRVCKVDRVDRVGRVGWPARAAFIVAAAVWLGCAPPEAFRGGKAGLTTTGPAGAGGAAGTAGQAGISGADASSVGGAVGQMDAAAPTGVGGDPGGAAGVTGTAGAAGAPTAAGMAGSSAAGAVGSGAAGAAGSSTGTGGADAGSATGTAGTTAPPPPTQLSLPFNVTDHYTPTGFMGDGIVAGSVTMTATPAACNGEPAAAMAGVCFTVTYHPQPIVAPAPSTWGGVYWQHPDNNWGTMQPQTVASGAKDISFYAKGMAGGEAVTFQAGGIINAISTATPYTDSFTIRQTFTLTTTWTKYTLPMTGLGYGSGVLGGFAWVATATNANPVTFFVHGIVWE